MRVRRCQFGFIGCLIALSLVVNELLADETIESERSVGFPNLKLPTLGGKQFWSDQLLFHDWRIQRHSETGHCRLLDGRNVRHAWGNFAHCAKKLESIKLEKRLPAMRGKAVLVLHGLVGTRRKMKALCEFLRDRSDYQIFNIAYPSTRLNIATHAANLARIIEHLDGIEEINFVAHSMGNLVIRHYFADKMKAQNRRAGPRIGRMVMLAPPNQGADIAERMKNNGIFQLVWGKSGREIADWETLRPHLATPPCEFGILAGGRNTEGGFNLLIDGDDDFVVRVDETRLMGAGDFVVVLANHLALSSNERVHALTLRFMQHGFFVSKEKRHPIQ